MLRLDNVSAKQIDLTQPQVRLTCPENLYHLKLEFSRKLNEGAKDEEEPVQRRADHRDFEAA